MINFGQFSMNGNNVNVEINIKVHAVWTIILFINYWKDSVLCWIFRYA